jgi:hypothetical protein
MEYFELFDCPLKIGDLSPSRGLPNELSWVDSLPREVSSSQTLSSKNITIETDKMSLLSPIELSNKEIIWALVEYSIWRGSHLYFCLPIEIISSEKEDLLFSGLNRLEPQEFWTKSESHSKIYDTFIKDSQVKVFQGEGQQVKGNNLLLGTKIGPNLHDLSALIHEMSHLIDINDKRVLKPGWGFFYGQSIEIMGRTYKEPVTYRASLRECKVLAIQQKIQESVGITADSKELIRPLQFMNDWCLIPGKTDEDRYTFLIERLNEYSKNIDLEYILSEWNRKQEILR